MTTRRTLALALAALILLVPWSAIPGPSDAAGEDAPELHRLPGGLRLLLRADRRLPLVWICAAGSGGWQENASQAGITSLMAECLPRGARGQSAETLARAVEARGAALTAFAGRNSFGLQAHGLAADTPFLLDLLADCLLAPDFDPAEVSKQKALQLAAIRQQREAPLFIAQDTLRQALFPGHPAGGDPLGRPESLENMDAAQLRAWHARLVCASNLVLAVFGDIDPARIRRQVARLGRRLPAGAPPPWPEAPAPASPQTIRRAEPREQTVILAGFPAPDVRDPCQDALDLLQQALSGLGSELALAIRDRRGLAYYAGASHQPGLAAGCFTLYAGTRAAATEQVTALLRDEIRRVTLTGLTPDELARARQKLALAHAQRRQFNGELALESALNELYGRGCDYAWTADRRLAALDAAAVRQVAASVLDTNRMVIVIVAPAAAPAAR